MPEGEYSLREATESTGGASLGSGSEYGQQEFRYFRDEDVTVLNPREVIELIRSLHDARFVRR
jgi:hypothetical protein